MVEKPDVSGPRRTEEFWSEGLLHDLGLLIDSMRTTQFAENLKDFLLKRIEFRNFVFVIFEDEKKPHSLYHWSPFEPNDFFHKMYLPVAYLLDPYYIASQKKVDSGTYTLDDLAPDEFFHSEYYRTYYIRVNMIDELAYLLQINDRRTLHMSLGRRQGSRNYQRRAIHLLTEFESVLFPLLRQHVAWRLLEESHPEPPEAQSLLDHLRNLDDPELKKSPLTLREAEIVALTLQGHSSESTALALGISPWTVKVHRRKIYAKLQISSQLELFRRFMILMMP